MFNFPGPEDERPQFNGKRVTRDIYVPGGSDYRLVGSAYQIDSCISKAEIIVLDDSEYFHEFEQECRFIITTEDKIYLVSTDTINVGTYYEAFEPDNTDNKVSTTLHSITATADRLVITGAITHLHFRVNEFPAVAPNVFIRPSMYGLLSCKIQDILACGFTINTEKQIEALYVISSFPIN